jgi:phosphoribosylaminoimidazole carboxylase PurE protein
MVNGKVAILMGSRSDADVMAPATKVLDEFGVSYEIKVLSAHRTPQDTSQYVEAAEGNGIDVIIAGAGYAAHLAGAVAAHTTLPVLGVPIDSSALNGVDALYSTVQMPGGIPVATMTIGKAGAKNAALFAIQILSRREPELGEKLKEYRRRMREDILAIQL